MAEVRLRGLAVLVLRRPHEHRLDAELSEAQPFVGVELHRRAGYQGEPLVAGVLEQVVGELLGQPVLVALELLAVLGREVDVVLIRDVRAGNGDGLVVLHLLRELARDLDRLDARLERPAEGALEQPLELRFQVSEDAHGD